MKQQGFDHAQEEIRKVLVQEYLRQHPGAREQDVIIACKDGELVFTEISSVLADVELRKQSGQILMQASRMFSELAVHHDERWKQCVESSQHCMQMIDCLHSTISTHFSDIDRYRYQNTVRRLEGICAVKTVQLQDASQKLVSLKKSNPELNTLNAKSIVVDYLLLVIDQLKAQIAIMNQEIKIGDLFLQHAEKYMKVQMENPDRRAATFHLPEIRKMIESKEGSSQSTVLNLEQSYSLNERLLLVTRDTLLEVVELLTEKLKERRRRIHEIWTAISTLEETVSDIHESDPLLPPCEPYVHEPEKFHIPTPRRMARYQEPRRKN